MARGEHTSPQRTLFKKRRKSYLKNRKRVMENDLILRKLRTE